MEATVIPGFSMWSQWQPDRNLYFNSFFIETPSGNVVVDPLPLDDALAADIEKRGGVEWIVVTNRDHERATAAAAERFGAKVAASAPEAELLTVSVDRKLEAGDELCGARIFALA
ncbi:MAG: MBL fold metallo-hydrolase, partial [Vulcanimicrobiaceae bacterium]